jgi:hypothetical protein
MKIALPNLFMLSNRNRTDCDVEDELQFHIEMLQRTYAQQGMSEVQAKAAALKRFGNLERVKKQCVDISRRNGPLRRVLKASLIFIALIGLSISILSPEYKVARIGNILIVIAVAGRVLLYVHGLGASAFLPGAKQTSLSVFKDTPEDGART